MILKSYIVEQNIEVLNGYQGVLIHGKNHGIKDDVKKKIRNKNKNSEIIIFFEEEILKEKNILKPAGSVRIEDGDQVVLFALSDDVREVERLLQVTIDFF